MDIFESGKNAPIKNPHPDARSAGTIAKYNFSRLFYRLQCDHQAVLPDVAAASSGMRA